MTNKKCEGIDCAWCMSIECPNEKKTEMTDKEHNFVKDINVSHKRKIKCKYKIHDDYHFNGKPYCTCFNELCEDLTFACDHNCQIYEDYKQLTRKTQECEELKDYAKRQENQRESYYKEYLKIDNALEEIEKTTKINCEEICGRKFEDCNDTSCFSAELLNIINKAKGEEKCQ